MHTWTHTLAQSYRDVLVPYTNSLVQFYVNLSDKPVIFRDSVSVLFSIQDTTVSVTQSVTLINMFFSQHPFYDILASLVSPITMNVKSTVKFKTSYRS